MLCYIKSRGLHGVLSMTARLRTLGVAGTNTSSFGDSVNICCRLLQSSSDRELKVQIEYAEDVLKEELSESNVNTQIVLNTHRMIVGHLARQLNNKEELITGLRQAITAAKGLIQATQQVWEHHCLLG